MARGLDRYQKRHLSQSRYPARPSALGITFRSGAYTLRLVELPKIDFHYFRYVDDIRLFANNEKDLRRLLVALDLMSKDIGLFPQSAKIGIHKVADIERELKSISNPPEPAIKNRLVNQKRLFRRIVELTPHYSISDPTRFKSGPRGAIGRTDKSSLAHSR